VNKFNFLSQLLMIALNTQKNSLKLMRKILKTIRK